MYLALLPKTSRVTHHTEGDNDDLGFKSDNSTVTKQMLEESGGSKNDFMDFCSDGFQQFYCCQR